jgi:hypothetical protein
VLQRHDPQPPVNQLADGGVLQSRYSSNFWITDSSLGTPEASKSYFGEPLCQKDYRRRHKRRLHSEPQRLCDYGLSLA